MSRLSLDDTIAAIATAPAEGALGIVRMSGPEAVAIADRIVRIAGGHGTLTNVASHTVHYGHVMDGDMEVDEVLATVLRAPRTYTREESVEITGHGGPYALRRILDLLLQHGARLAEPGEFTQRAFLNGRIDLAQGEAVLDVIRARTDASLRTALDQLGGRLSDTLHAVHRELANLVAHVEATIDFPEEEVDFLKQTQCQERITRVHAQLEAFEVSAHTGRILREGAMVVICGRPNVGKSSLLNALLKTHRAIVTDQAGTTRDTIDEVLNLQGLPVRIVDTAGMSSADDADVDPVEQEGIERSRRAVQQADALLVVFDQSVACTAADAALVRELKSLRHGSITPLICVLNKSDKIPALASEDVARYWDAPQVTLSAMTAEGIDALEQQLVELLWGGAVDVSRGTWMTNARHQEAVRAARQACASALQALEAEQTIECLALDLRAAVQHVGDILGVNVQEDMLDRIFRQFCIGK